MNKEEQIVESSQSPEEHKKWLEEQKNTWKKRAKDYEKLDWVQKDDFLLKMIQYTEPEKDWAGIDIGAGTGKVASAVSKFIDTVVGIDISEEMITEANKLHRESGNISFEQGDVENLRYDKESFDMATARMVFHHVDDCLKGMKEVFRVLKPGGHFMLCEGVPPDHLTRDRYERIFELKEKRHTFSEAELINLFDKAGFQDIVVRPYFMRQVSLNNWLNNGALDQVTIDEIRRLHVESEPHFKYVYNLNEVDGDVLMDWKFIFIRGTR